MLTVGSGKRLLGISLGERSLAIAELSFTAEVPQPARTAEFAFPPGITLDDASALGAALGQFIAEQGFTARRAVFGVPSRWLVSRTCDIPPSDPETATRLLWFDAVEHTSPELGSVIYDFVGKISQTQTTSVLTLGLQKTRLDHLHVLAEAAQLKTLAVVSTGAAIAAASNPHCENAMILFIRPEGVELIIDDHGQARALRHLGALSSSAALITQLRRADATRSRGPGAIVLWDEAGVDSDFIAALEGFAGAPVKRAAASWVRMTEPNSSPVPHGLSAAALTMPFRLHREPEIDFRRPRLYSANPIAARTRSAWLSAAAAIILLALLIGFFDISHLQHQISSEDQTLASLQPALETARPFVTSMQFAESYSSSKPRYLCCLKDLTQAIAPQEKTYFLSFDLDQQMRGIVAGRSESEQDILNFLDKLKSSGRFLDLRRTLDARAGRSAGNEVVFSVYFTYRPG